MRQSGQDSEGVSKVADDLHYVLHHIRRKAGLHGNSFHPLGEVVRHTQNVFVSIECLGQRPSDIQTEPLPRLCHLPSQHDIMEKYSHYRNISLYWMSNRGVSSHDLPLSTFQDLHTLSVEIKK